MTGAKRGVDMDPKVLAVLKKAKRGTPLMKAWADAGYPGSKSNIYKAWKSLSGGAAPSLPLPEPAPPPPRLDGPALRDGCCCRLMDSSLAHGLIWLALACMPLNSPKGWTTAKALTRPTVVLACVGLCVEVVASGLH